MMQFSMTGDWIYNASPHTGERKTATSRPVKPDEVVFPTVGSIEIVRTGRRVVYAVGQDYAVQLGRGKSSIGRICITRIAKYDVRTITAEQVRKEGFGDTIAFLAVWTAIHDKTFYARWAGEFQYNGAKRTTVLDALNGRQTPKYTAWLLDFEPL